MAESINDILSRTPSGGTAVLPAGEFEGPVYITKPLRLVGSNTTIWARRGSVIEITAAGAQIEGLRVELTEGDVNEKAVIAHARTVVRDVEILGSCSGFGAEDGIFDFPKTIALGSFAADKENTYKLKVNVPTDAEIECGISGVTFSPSRLSAGLNDVTLTVNSLSSMTYLYGEILLKSMFTRRVYISGRPVPDGEQAQDKLLYEAPERQPVSRNEVQNTPVVHTEAADVYTVNMPAPLYDMPVLDMRRGQRISLYQYIGNRCEISFTCMKPQHIEIDPYVFLLDSNEKSFDSRGLVFFGNETDDSGSVNFSPDTGRIEIDFERIDYRVQRITLAYSIYAGNAAKSFALVKAPKITISANGSERITYTMYGLTTEVTVVAMEFYRYKGEWKVSAIGSGYRNGLVKLCNNYGIEVTE